MRLARMPLLLFGAALIPSRGLFAQEAVPDTALRPAAIAADQLPVRLRIDPRYAQPEPLLFTTSRGVKALYVNAWAFGSNKLWHLVHLADSTEINAFVIDVKDDTGCLLYPSAVQTAQEIGANDCVRTRSIRARLDTLLAHGIYPIPRIVVAKDPRLAEPKPEGAVRWRDGGRGRDRINVAWG